MEFGKTKNGILLLEDGRKFLGYRFGAMSDAVGEVVFNTSMTGYQEIISDPSYTGQIVVMTYPQIGNYGLAAEDFESRKLFLSALIVKEVSRIASNWRFKYTLDDYLKKKGIPGLAGFDTRALVGHIRANGAMRGIISDSENDTTNLLRLVQACPSMAGRDLASEVTNGNTYMWTDATYRMSRPKVAAKVTEDSGRKPLVVTIDYGIKWNILRRLIDSKCRVTIVPANTSAADILALSPDGVVLSNGPGDPDPLNYAVDSIKYLIGRVPIFGICLGHQLLSIAAGGKTYKLKFGHRGGNHPVMHLASGKVEITSHNHGFSVDTDSLSDSRVEITHCNLNDQTIEGISLRNAPAFSVQYHPEAAPGPHDAHYMFQKFVDQMTEWADRN
jgi:carbamoyl-phosphate synthase small subunit